MIIFKTASRNVAFKAARMSEHNINIIMENQGETIMPRYEKEEIESEKDKQAVLDDIGFNADIFIIKWSWAGHRG